LACFQRQLCSLGILSKIALLASHAVAVFERMPSEPKDRENNNSD